MKKTTAVFAVILFSALILLATAKHFCFCINPLNYMDVEYYRSMLISDFITEIKTILMSVFSIASIVFILKKGKESIILQILAGIVYVSNYMKMSALYASGFSLVMTVFSQQEIGIEIGQLRVVYGFSFVITAFILALLIGLSIMRSVLGIKFLNKDAMGHLIDSLASILLSVGTAAGLIFAFFSFIVLQRDITLAEYILMFVSQSILSAGTGLLIRVRNSLDKRKTGLIEEVSSFINKDGELYERFMAFILCEDEEFTFEEDLTEEWEDD